MLRMLKRKRWIAALGALAVLAIAGTAVAFFTAGGNGTGSATVGTVSSNIAISGDVASGSYLFPGGEPVTVPITVTNNGTTAVHVGTVTLTKVVASGTETAAQCDVSAFTMDPVSIDQTVSPNGGKSTVVNGSVKMADTKSNQDACQGASLALTFATGI